MNWTLTSFILGLLLGNYAFTPEKSQYIDIRSLCTSVTTLMVVVGLVLWARRVATEVGTLVVCRRKGLFMPETCLVCFRDAIFKRTATTKPLCSFGSSSLPEELTCSLFSQGSMDGKHMVGQNPRRCTLW